MDQNKSLQKIDSEKSLKKLSEDSSLAKRGLRDIGIWPKIEELFEKLKSQYEAEKYQDCIITAEEILKTDANHFSTLCYYGRSLFHLEKYKEALKVLEQCIKEEKEYYFLWSFYGDIFYKLGEFAEAVKNYDEALKFELWKADDINYNPNQSKELDIFDNYLSYLNEDKEQNEMGYFKKAQFYLSKKPEIYNTYGNNIGIERAVEALKRVRKLDPKNWYVTLQLIIRHLTFSGMSTAKKRVDEDLSNLLPTTFEKFLFVQNKLQSKKPKDWASAVYSCKEILKDLADFLYPATNEDIFISSNRKIRLSNENYIARLKEFIKSNTSDNTKTLHHFLDFIGERIDSIYKPTKKCRLNIRQEEAENYLAFTYVLIIGKILELYKLKEE